MTASVAITFRTIDLIFDFDLGEQFTSRPSLSAAVRREVSVVEGSVASGIFQRRRCRKMSYTNCPPRPSARSISVTYRRSSPSRIRSSFSCGDSRTAKAVDCERGKRAKEGEYNLRMAAHLLVPHRNEFCCSHLSKQHMDRIVRESPCYQVSWRQQSQC
jgi:hypothetical protein